MYRKQVLYWRTLKHFTYLVKFWSYEKCLFFPMIFKQISWCIYFKFMFVLWQVMTVRRSTNSDSNYSSCSCCAALFTTPLMFFEDHILQNVTDRCFLQALLIMFLFCVYLGFKTLHFSLFILWQVANGAQVENKMNLPVPVYLRPLDQKDASMKVQRSTTR